MSNWKTEPPERGTTRNEVEERVVDAIDEAEHMAQTMSEEEIIAFAIGHGLQRPEGKFTREWANKVMAGIAKCHTTAKLATYVLRTDDMGVLDKYLDYYVSKAPRPIAHGQDPNADPMGVNVGGTLLVDLLRNIDGKSRGLPRPDERA